MTSAACLQLRFGRGPTSGDPWRAAAAAAQGALHAEPVPVLQPVCAAAGGPAAARAGQGQSAGTAGETEETG